MSSTINPSSTGTFNNTPRDPALSDTTGIVHVLPPSAPFRHLSYPIQRRRCFQPTLLLPLEARLEMCVHFQLVDHCVSCSSKQDYGVLMKDCGSPCGSIQRPIMPGSPHSWICPTCNPDPAQTPELYELELLVKKSMIIDQNRKNAGRFMSYAVDTQEGRAMGFAKKFQQKFPKEYAEEYAAFKGWQKDFMATFEECRRRGIFLDGGSDVGDGRAKHGLLEWLVALVSRTRL